MFLAPTSESLVLGLGKLRSREAKHLWCFTGGDPLVSPLSIQCHTVPGGLCWQGLGAFPAYQSGLDNGRGLSLEPGPPVSPGGEGESSLPEGKTPGPSPCGPPGRQDLPRGGAVLCRPPRPCHSSHYHLWMSQSEAKAAATHSLSPRISLARTNGHIGCLEWCLVNKNASVIDMRCLHSVLGAPREPGLSHLHRNPPGP